MSPTSVACVFAKVARYCRRSTWIVVASLAHSEALTRGRCSWWQPSGVVLRAWQAERERARCSSLRRPHRASVGRRRGAVRRRSRRVRHSLACGLQDKEVIKSSAPTGGEIVIEFRIVRDDLEILSRPNHYTETDPFQKNSLAISERFEPNSVACCSSTIRNGQSHNLPYHGLLL